MKSLVSKSRGFGKSSSVLRDILAIDGVKIDKDAGLRIDGQNLFYNEIIFMLNYPDHSPEVSTVKKYVDQKRTGYYAICCSDGTYLIKATKDRVQRQFIEGLVVNPNLSQ